ncbi:MAG: hypothetical protein NE334_14810 [Lentisphaeraceae bacterium]|nr:hypothetical protein [Lentisphaeraceae bacterium]
MRKINFILIALLMYFVGFSSMGKKTGDSFAPRPENAKSDSIQIVRLDESRYSEGLSKLYLLEKIKRYRQDYETIKTESDFSSNYVNQNPYDKYLKNLQSFKDSDLDAAEAYLKSLPDSIKFTPTSVDQNKRDYGDINWRDKDRTLRVADFYGDLSNSGWSPYAFIINMIPTARVGYGKLELNVDGESLYFRKNASKFVWRLTPTYYRVNAKIQTLENAQGQLPMLLQIYGANNPDDMNGTYLVMPREGASINTSAIDALRKAEEQAKLDPNYTPPIQLDAGPYTNVSNENIIEAEIICEGIESGLSKEDLHDLIGANPKDYLGKLHIMASICSNNPRLFRIRVDEVKNHLPKTTSSTSKTNEFNIISKNTLAEAEIIMGELGRSRSPKQVLEHFQKYRKSVNDKGLLIKLIKLYKQDRNIYKERIDVLHKN